MAQTIPETWYFTNFQTGWTLRSWSASAIASVSTIILFNVLLNGNKRDVCTPALAHPILILLTRAVYLIQTKKAANVPHLSCCVWHWNSHAIDIETKVGYRT